MRHLALHLCLCLLSVTVNAATAPAAAAAGTSEDLDRVMHALAARRHGEVSFIEQHFLALLKRPAESSGELIYDAPNRLEKRTLEPRPESLVLDGTVLTVQRGHKSRVLDLKSYPQILPYVESIRATLAGDRFALERTFQLHFVGNFAQWSLLLAPADAELAKSVAQIQIDGAKDDLLKVEIRQSDGDRSVLTLRPHAPGTAPAPKAPARTAPADAAS